MWTTHNLKIQIHWFNIRSKVAGKLSAEQTVQNVCLTQQLFLKYICLNLNMVLSKQQKLPSEILELHLPTTLVHLAASIALNFSYGLKVQLLRILFLFYSLFTTVEILPHILDHLLKHVTLFLEVFCFQ